MIKRIIEEAAKELQSEIDKLILGAMANKVCEDCTHNRYCGGEYVDENGCFYKHVKDENGIVYPRPEEVNGDNKEEKEMEFNKNVDAFDIKFSPDDRRIKLQIRAGEDIYLFTLKDEVAKNYSEKYVERCCRLVEEKDNLEKLNDKLKQDINDLSRNYNSYAAENFRLKKERDKLLEKNEQLEKKRYDLQIEKARLEQEKNRIEADRKRVIEEHRESDEEQFDSYKALYEEFRQLKQDNDKNIKRNKELNKQIDEMVLNANKKVNTDEEPHSRRDILRCAEKCVCGKREQDYGTPESNFQLIADLWNGYLGNNLSKEKKDFEKELGITHNRKELSVPWEISALDVSMMMALLKIARIRNGGGTGDSFVDLAGYAACGGEINAQKKATKTN